MVPAKQSSTTSVPSPMASKIWAPTYDATVETPILLITLRTPLASASTTLRVAVPEVTPVITPRSMRSSTVSSAR